MRTELRSIVLADKLSNSPCLAENLDYFKKNVSSILGDVLEDGLFLKNSKLDFKDKRLEKKVKEIGNNKIDFFTILDFLKIDKLRFTKGLGKLDVEEICNKIFDYIEDIFHIFGLNIEIKSLYYNFGQNSELIDIIDIYSRNLSKEEKYKETRNLRDAIISYEKNIITLINENTICIPIYNILSHNHIIGYITVKIEGNIKEEVFFISNLIFKNLNDIIYSTFMENYEKLVKNVFIDGLTGAFKRDYGLNKFETDLSYISLPSGNNINHLNNDIDLLFVDIDHFKNFNDAYGHEMGDNVLSIFVEAIIKSIRKTDYVVRYGGEEFIIILKTSKAGKDNIFKLVKKIQQKINKNLQELIRRNNIPENITFSGGTVNASSILNDNSKERVKDMLAIADARLYDAKNNGRNQIVLQNGEIIK